MSSLYDPTFPLLDNAVCEYLTVGAVSTDTQALLDEAGYDLSELDGYIEKATSKGQYPLASRP